MKHTSFCSYTTYLAFVLRNYLKEIYKKKKKTKMKITNQVYSASYLCYLIFVDVT